MPAERALARLVNSTAALMFTVGYLRMAGALLRVRYAGLFPEHAPAPVEQPLAALPAELLVGPGEARTVGDQAQAPG